MIVPPPDAMARKPDVFTADDFPPTEGRVCDLIMNGGLTSGVVYPQAICTLASRYRLGDIGGASSGAIAAALAAAAEFHRARAGGVLDDAADAGYLRLSRLHEFFGEQGNLSALFQPTPRLRPQFLATLGALRAWRDGGGLVGVVASLLRRFPRTALLAALLALVPFAFAVLGGAHFLALLASAPFAFALALLAAVTAVLGYAAGATWKCLPDVRFGFCNGHAESDGSGGDMPPLTDWLHTEIQATAALPEGDALTFGELADEGVGLAVMVTDLAQRRPYEMSLSHVDEFGPDEHFNGYLFRPSEFREMFPGAVVDKLLLRAERAADNLYRWPAMRDVPVLVAARMSFGFPVLLQAVPLYRADVTLRDDRAPLRRCLISDGGIASNLPIEFFDTALPDRATFAIALEPYDVARHGDTPDGRVAMFTGGPTQAFDPKRPAGRRRGVPVNPVESLPLFLASLLYTAKDWRDVVQGTQAGYRDRIVHVGLHEDTEGGLNLDMGREATNRLANLGRAAGGRLLEFDFDVHRWRRLLVTTDMFEREVAELHASWRGTSGDSFRAFVGSHAPRERDYPPSASDARWVDDALGFFDSLTDTATDDVAQRVGERITRPLPRTDLQARPRL